MVSQKTLYVTEYHSFLINCVSFSSFFDAEKISKQFIVPAVTIQKIHVREVFSLYRVSSLTAHKYMRQIIVLFLVCHCIEVYNIHRVYSLPLTFGQVLNTQVPRHFCTRDTEHRLGKKCKWRMRVSPPLCHIYHLSTLVLIALRATLILC